MWQQDQHHELEMSQQQAVFNQIPAVIDQKRQILLRLQARIQCQINHTHAPNKEVLPGENPISDINLDDL